MAGRSKALVHLNYPEGLRGTSRDAKVLYTRLLSDDALNHAGVVPLRVALWADHCEMSEVEINDALRDLEEHRFAYTDWKTHQVLVRTLIRNDEIANIPNILHSACRAALNLRSEKLRRVLATELRKLAPQPPDKINEQSGKRYVYPDPHGTADKIDPGPPGPGERSHGSHPASHRIPSHLMPSHEGSPGDGDGEGEESPVGENSSQEDFFSSGFADANPDTPPQPEPAEREDVTQLVDRLCQRLRENGVKTPGGGRKAWRTQARLLLDRDKRDLTQALRLIDWATSHHFWAANIHSMPTFREKYDKLLAQARREQQPQLPRSNNRPNADDKIRYLQSLKSNHQPNALGGAS
jgi:hypothetical protein